MSKFGSREVVDLAIFDGDGSLIANLDTLKYSKLYLGETQNSSYVEVEDALLDVAMLELLGQKEIRTQSDFGKMLSGVSNNQTVININSRRDVAVKLIGRGIWRSQDTGKDIPFKFVVNHAVVNNPIVFENDCGEHADVFRWKFKIIDQSNGDICKLIID